MKTFKQGDKVKVVSGIMNGSQGVVDRQIGNNYIVEFKADDSGLSWSINMAPDELELDTTYKQMALGAGAYFFGDYGHDSHSDDQKKKWKDEGRCQECGHLLPMSIWGLGECPYHPKPGGPQ